MSDQPRSLTGTTLAQHYKVTERVGAGGMGEVYRAWDTTLGREVAIKVLPTAVAVDTVQHQRFAREARTLASLNHPNIATIHGFEVSEGVQFLVMEMVDGETLAERIARGPIPPDEAVGLFGQVADALEAAHEKGIIHRDLKPANVKITPGGRVKVLDFGLAKSFDLLPSGPDSSASQKVTRTQTQTRAGTIVGTIAYMSPEQARGQPLDGRTDVWSFGCTLYEALTGSAAFRGDSLVDTIAAIIEREPDWSALPEGGPSDLRDLLGRCLAKAPDSRPESREIRSALEQARALPRRRALTSAAAAALVIALVTVGVWWVWRVRSGDPTGDTTAPTHSTSSPTVAVTALTNLTGDDDLDWLEEGLANLVRDRLAESRHVAVVSKPRWDAISRTAEDPGSITTLAAEAGIDYVVSGEYLSAPGGLLLTARVMDVESGQDLVARRIDGLTPETLLESTNRLALLTKQALGIPHTERVELFAADFVVDRPVAYESYLAGLDFFGRFAFRDAERAFRSAVDLEPGFHIARYRLAHVLAATGRTEEALVVIGEIPTDAALSRRERLYVEAARALFSRDYAAARDGYQELLDEYPYEVEAREFLAEVFDQEYDDAAALEQLLILAKQEPENPGVWVSLGETHLRLGQLEHSEEALDRYLSLAPQDPYGFTVLGELRQAEGRYDVAAEHLQRALELNPDFPPAWLGLARVRALGGELDDAERMWRDIVHDADAIPADRIDAAFELSSLLRAQGRFEESLTPLEALESLIREEEIREAQALAVRGLGHLELNEPSGAERLIDLAVERSPSVPTRYLFARGLVQLHLGDVDAVRRTAAAIRSHALPADDPDRTEDKAAAYLEGMADLEAGAAQSAVRRLREAVALEGYRYALYRLGLATALSTAGHHVEAAKLAAEAAADRDPVDPRLDLELDRRRALLLEASIWADAGVTERARPLADAFLELWARAPADHPDVTLARRIAGPE
jgi:tetratricopeptide (TPR) repeat protein